MSRLLHVGEVVGANAHLFPDKVAARDLARSMTFRLWNQRACRLANGLLGLGLRKGDRVAVLAYNCVEWLEIYVAVAKAGLVAVPINPRLLGEEIRYIVEDARATALIVQEDLLDRVDGIRATLSIPERNYLNFGATRPPRGYRQYEEIIAKAASLEPLVAVGSEDAWALMYTSGTTGKPKGAIQTHGSGAVLSLITELDFGFTRNDTALLVMPLCHANSLYFFSTFAYCGASCCIYDRRTFDPEHLLRTFDDERPTFSSLVPTHYIMMLGLSETVKRKYEASSLTKLLTSSAPARRETKLAVMEHFKNSQLYELYGSTEAGWVTLLRPDEQFTKLGSVGRELTGSGRIKILDDDGHEAPNGEVGELYSRTPYTFAGYWNLPDRTTEAFRGPYCTVGDMARRDEDGYYYLVDRKKNMIISGGENVYPSEVENLLGLHPKVKDVAVIGIPHEKWGESVHGVVVLHEKQAVTEVELLDWCKDKIAGYKRPRSISFIAEGEMPRTATGKILHRVLRERLSREP
ncbi:MAG TPA: AMP-binding protein [bacterium]|nr:AMP-binding protein [bacterium]